MSYWLEQQPIFTGAYALYPWSATLKRRFTKESRYEEPILLYRELGVEGNRKLALPRVVCPPGKVDKTTAGVPWKFNSTFKPRNSEQARVVEEASDLLAKDESFLIRAPTGFGKTICAMQLIASKSRKTIVVVTKEDVRDQWAAAAKMVLGLKPKDIGFIQGDTCVTKGKGFVIAMIQSLSKPAKYPSNIFSDFGLVIWDECHRVAADQFSNTAWLFPAKCRIGLSATPTRKDGKDVVLNAHIGPIKVETDQMKLIPKVFVMRTKVSLPMVTRKIKGQFKQVPLPHTPGRVQTVNKFLGQHTTRNKAIGQFILSCYKKGRTTLVFSDTKAHLEMLHEVCMINGIKYDQVSYYVGGMKKAAREEAKTKKVILTTYAMTSEGTDMPWVDTGILTTPRSDIVQIVGRILREYPNKKQPVILDVYDPVSSVLTGYYKKRVEFYKYTDAEFRYL